MEIHCFYISIIYQLTDLVVTYKHDFILNCYHNVII